MGEHYRTDAISTHSQRMIKNDQELTRLQKEGRAVEDRREKTFQKEWYEQRNRGLIWTLHTTEPLKGF